MSQAGFFLSGSTTIDSITGNTGVPVTPVGGDINIVTANSTVLFSGAGNTLTLDFAPVDNLLVGVDGGGITTGVTNVSLGQFALDSLTSGSANNAFGSASLADLTTGDNNTALGAATLPNLVSGSANLAVGSGSGQNYTGAETANIDIGNPGVVGESFTIRLGNNPQHNRCFIAGIEDVDLNTKKIVTIDNDQLGSATLITQNATIQFYPLGPNAITLDFSEDNLILGSSGPAITTGTDNTSIGVLASNSITSGSSNTTAGSLAGAFISSGDENVAIGQLSLKTTSGSSNIAIGSRAGIDLLSNERNNIVIGNRGITGTSNVTRIGTNAAQTSCYIAGIENVNLNTAELVTVNNDQLGSTTLTAGSNISVTPGAGIITIASTVPGGINWVIATSNLTMAENTGYITKNVVPAAQLLYALPTTCAIGKIVRITGYSAGGWRITQDVGQIIHFGAFDTTVGAAGYVESTDLYDSVELVCVVANLAFNVISSQGNLTII